MDSVFTSVDSVNAINQIMEMSCLTQTSCLDVFYKISTIVIALSNLIFVVYVFKSTSNRENENIEKNRKIALFKTLVLDYNMEYLYLFFDELREETNKLSASTLNNEEKTEINEKVLLSGQRLRQKFIDLFIAIDLKLYENLLRSIDELQDHITITIFDEGINLSYAPKFQELITDKITNAKTCIIKLIFEYSGE